MKCKQFVPNQFSKFVLKQEIRQGRKRLKEINDARSVTLHPLQREQELQYLVDQRDGNQIMKDFEVEDAKAQEIYEGEVDNSEELAEREVERKKKIHFSNIAFRSGVREARRHFGGESIKDNGEYFSHRPHPTLHKLLEQMNGEPSDQDTLGTQSFFAGRGMGDTATTIDNKLALVEDINRQLTLTKHDANKLEDELRVHIHSIKNQTYADSPEAEPEAEAKPQSTRYAQLLGKRLTLQVKKTQDNIKKDIVITDTDVWKQIKKNAKTFKAGDRAMRPEDQRQHEMNTRHVDERLKKIH